MGVPKRKTSKMKLRHRRSSNNRYKKVDFSNCKYCGASIQSHRVCISCGKYKDKQILVIKND